MASKLFPMLSCSDLTRSLAFYGDLLGGVETYRFPEEGEPAFVALTIGESSEIGLGGIAAEPFTVGRSVPRPATGSSSASTSTTSTVSSRRHARAGSKRSPSRRTCRGASGSPGSPIPTAIS